MVRRREHHAQIGRIVRCEVDYLPRIEQLDILALRHIARPCIIEILSDLDAARRLGIPKVFGRFLVIGQCQQFVGHGLAHSLDEFRIGGGIHGGHFLYLSVPGITVPKIHAVQIIGIETRLDLCHEIGNLRIREIAKAQARIATFNTKTDFTAFVLQRPDIFVCMFQHIANIRIKIQYCPSSFCIAPNLNRPEIYDITVSPLPNGIERRHALGFLQNPNICQ